MLDRQGGTLNLYWVAIFSAALALLAMAALMSMRYERNLFAEAAEQAGQLLGGSAAGQMAESARRTLAPGAGKGDGVMRKCVIDGKTVISNTDCLPDNPTSKRIVLHETRGVIAPKRPEPVGAEATSSPALDKVIEKQLN